MRFVHLHVRTALLAFATLGVCSCHSAQKTVSAKPPADPPALQAPAKSVSASAQKPASPAQPDQQLAAEQQHLAATPPEQNVTPHQAAALSPIPDPVAVLVENAEKKYQTGLANYHGGKQDDAKQNFDDALNSLLSSNLDIRSDQRLEKEFDRIVQGVNDLYPGGTATEEQAESQEPQQKSEPAPIDQTNELSPEADARTKAKAEADVKNTRSDLPLMMTDQVAGFIAYFSNRGRGIFERALARSGRYRGLMLPILKEEGVPQDLIYLAQAESGFHPLAVSRVGARGIWQFMGSRARGYGLSHNMYLDDRQDPEKSTRAAARHLKDLYNQFGDWYLAMAAYNSGPGTVQAAVKRTGYADFWELYNRNVLPRETKNYVPIILAVTIMAKNPKQYGLEDVVLERPAEYDTVTIDYPVDLRLVAECVGSTPSELQDLNPSLLRMTTPRAGKFELHLPAGTRDDYESAIATIPPDMRLWWRYHVVKPGETLASLARTYHTTIRQISEVNHLEGRQVDPEARLVIPVTPGKHAAADTATYARRITRYHVRKGDTVQSVADNFGISPQQLRRWNGLRSTTNSLAGRRVLALHLPISPGARDLEAASARTRSKRPKTEEASAKPPATKSSEVEYLAPQREVAVVHHRVRSGETLYSIANAYRTTVAALKRDNRNIAVIRPGMILNIQTVR
ncbi:MAG TPA: LysM peptidoglycan-binding domain-containing protein [Candidatus Sulfotelmatobacter sp.]|nr:LysM peptidoglycan-binding domain-containing protein [Candidatus Sulfotelmatobacter sp.]